MPLTATVSLLTDNPTFPAPLREAARLRLAYPESSSAALAAHTQPPLPKDTLHGRTRRLLALADHHHPTTPPTAPTSPTAPTARVQAGQCVPAAGVASSVDLPGDNAVVTPVTTAAGPTSRIKMAVEPARMLR